MQRTIEEQFRHRLGDPDRLSTRRQLLVLGMLAGSTWTVFLIVGYAALRAIH